MRKTIEYEISPITAVAKNDSKIDITKPYSFFKVDRVGNYDFEIITIDPCKIEVACHNSLRLKPICL